jgi:hypothetical protein
VAAETYLPRLGYSNSSVDVENGTCHAELLRRRREGREDGVVGRHRHVHLPRAHAAEGISEGVCLDRAARTSGRDRRAVRRGDPLVDRLDQFVEGVGGHELLLELAGILACRAHGRRRRHTMARARHLVDAVLVGRGVVS